MADHGRESALGACPVEGPRETCASRPCEARLLAEVSRRELVPALWLPSLAEQALRERLLRRMYVYVAERTVEACITQIFRKLGLREEPDGHQRVRAVLAYLQSQRVAVLSPDPSEQDELLELREQLARIAAQREQPMARLVGPDGSEVEIPASAFAALQAVVRDMAQGLTITLIPHDKELTTKEAADILGLSRPFLVKLLDRGEIPHHRVGTHRRLNVEDVLAYRELRAARRRDQLRKLTELSEQAEGGYR